ncbi:MAG: hypothetical protein AAGA68_24645 [Pseudomonadota bacterium]
MTCARVACLSPFALLGILLTPPGYAACCVDEDIADAFLPHLRFSRELPAELDVIGALPREFAFIGAQEMNLSNPSYTAAWRSELAEDETYEVVDSILVNDGWRPLPNERSYTSYGFVAHDDRRGQLTLTRGYCRDDRGRTLWLQAKARDAQSLAMITSSSLNGTTCEAHMRSQSESQRRNGDIYRVLPRLVMPKEAPIRGSGSGGSGHGVTIHAQTIAGGAVTLDGLLDHFAPQLRRQGWALDTTFRGTRSGGSIWTRQDGDDLHIGRLVVLEREKFSLEFTVDRS